MSDTTTLSNPASSAPTTEPTEQFTVSTLQNSSTPALHPTEHEAQETKHEAQSTQNALPAPNLKPAAARRDQDFQTLNLKPGKSGYNADIASLICERIASTPQSTAKLCEAPDMPGVATVYRWLRAHPEFAEMYILAKETQAYILIDQCLDLVDDTSQDWIKDEKGRPVPNRAHFQRIKIQIAHRQWLASKLLPRVYGYAKAKAAAHNEERRTKNQEQTSPESGFVMTEERRLELIEKRHQALEAMRAAEATEAAAPGTSGGRCLSGEKAPPTSERATSNEAPETKNEAPNSNEAPKTKHEEPPPPPPKHPTLKQWRAHFPEREHAYPPWYRRP